MKTILRSCFIASASDSKDLILRNILSLQESSLGFEVLEDTTIWNLVKDFVLSHNHAPDIQSLFAHFRQTKEAEIVTRLQIITNLKSLTQGDFLVRLEGKINDRRKVQWIEYLQTASVITTTGLEVKGADGKKVLLRGPIDAANYLTNKAHDIVVPSLGTRLSGEISNDGDAFKERYERVEADPLAGIGQFTGISQIDQALSGAKRWELWIHAAFTGGLKSTFAFNWCYNQAVYYLHDSLYFSLEMPYDQVRNIFYAMHSAHEKFKLIRTQLGIQQDANATSGLDYSKIKKGELNTNEKKFLFDYVVADFNDPKNNYGKIHIEVANPDKDDFTVADLRMKAELIFSKTPFAMIVVDHAGLMAPRKWVSSTTERINEVIRDLKRLAMSFHKGRGIAVVCLFQTNREAYKRILKAQESQAGKSGSDGNALPPPLYNLTDLSYANEAERCVAEGTRIKTQRGYLPIEEVIPRDQVWSSSGWKEVLSKFNNGLQERLKLVTDRGSELIATASHRLRVVEDGSLIWKSLKEIQLGDQVLGGYGQSITHKPRLPNLQLWKGEKICGNQKTPLRVPACVTSSLAYLMGAWDGEGTKHLGGVAWTGKRVETLVQDRLEQAFLDTFGHPIKRLEPKSRPGSFDLVKWPQPLKRWFEQVAGPRAQRVPEFVWYSGPTIQCAYLQGLFDTAGWANKQHTIGIKMKASSKNFLLEVQLILQGLEIDSKLALYTQPVKYKGENKVFYSFTLWIRGSTSHDIFTRLIGFTEPSKQKRLIERINKRKTSNRKGAVQNYAVPKTFLIAFSQVHPRGTTRDLRVPRYFFDLPKRAKDEGKVNCQGLKWLIRLAKWRGIESKELAFLSSLLNLQVMYVDTIESIGIGPVWDLEVEGDHEYQTGPLLSHNSADIITSTWIDKDLRLKNLVRYQNLKSRDDAPFEPFLARVEWLYRRIFTLVEAEAPRGSSNDEEMGKVIDDLL